MKVIKTGSTLRIFPNDVQTFDKIPVGTYEVDFHPMAGFSLRERENFTIHDKVYGNHQQKSNKIIDRYLDCTSNFGVILGGRKGTGKSLTAKLISNQLLEHDIPTIIVTNAYDGLVSFISSIQQKVMVLFDEFEKVFPYTKNDYQDGDDEQSALLGLFDGISNNNHLYVVTINDYKKLNPYFIGRTGRFYYNINYKNLSDDEYIEFIDDKLTIDFNKSKLLNFLRRINANYDQMSSIMKEINYGESIQTILEELNLSLDDNSDRKRPYLATIKMSNGDVVTSSGVWIDLLSESKTISEYVSATDDEEEYRYYFEINLLEKEMDNISKIKFNKSELEDVSIYYTNSEKDVPFTIEEVTLTELSSKKIAI